MLKVFGGKDVVRGDSFPLLLVTSLQNGENVAPFTPLFPTHPSVYVFCRPSNKCRNDDGELETLALQLGEGLPLLVKGEMDENCWSVAKALGRNSFIFQGTVERVAKTHFTGCEQAVLLMMLILCARVTLHFDTQAYQMVLRLGFHHTRCVVVLARYQHGYLLLARMGLQRLYTRPNILRSSDRNLPALVLSAGGVFHMSTEKNLALDHPVRRFLDPHLHPSGLFENRATILSPAGSFPFRDPLPERMVRKVSAFRHSRPTTDF